MQNILIFGSLPSGFGGMEKSMRYFANMLNQDSNFNVSFYFYDLNKNNNQNWLNNLEYTIYATTSSLRYIQKCQVKKNLAKFLSTYNFSTIIAFDPLSVKLARDVIHAKKLKIRLFSWLHFSIESYKPKYQNYITLADKHFVLCNEMKEQLIYLLQIKPSNIYAIYNPVPKKEVTIKKSLNNRFLYIGRVQYEGQKNLKELFIALSDLNEPFSLEIIGDKDDDEKRRLQKLATSLKIENSINWHGWQQDPWLYVENKIKAVSALVLTSTYEGLPMILIEALSYGIPCVSSNCKTGPQNIININNGFLYSLGDRDGLTNLLKEINNHSFIIEDIKNSVNFCYNENYFRYVKSILK